jgi:hypothetical protein
MREVSEKYRKKTLSQRSQRKEDEAAERIIIRLRLGVLIFLCELCVKFLFSVLEPFRKVSTHDEGVVNRRSISRIMARRMNAAALRA